MRGPIERLTANLPPRWRTAVDWLLTIVVAVGAVVAIKLWVVNPYRIPSPSMEPSLHCAAPIDGCEASFSDRVLANRFIYHFREPARGEIVVFDTTQEAEVSCTVESTTFVKRLIGLPGERVAVRDGVVFINGQRLREPYLRPERVGGEDFGPAVVPPDHFFLLGDNRVESCDSRRWGFLPRENLIGDVFAVYWPPQRIGFR